MSKDIFNCDKTFSKNVVGNRLCKIRVYKDLLTYTNELCIKSGYNGRDGKDGRDGIDGRDGVDGKDGRDGKDAKESIFYTKTYKQITSIESDILDSFVIPLDNNITIPGNGIYDITIQGDIPESSTLYIQINNEQDNTTNVNTDSTPGIRHVNKRIVMYLNTEFDIQLCSTFKGVINNCSIILIRLS